MSPQSVDALAIDEPGDLGPDLGPDVDRDLAARADRAREFLYGTITVIIAASGIRIGGLGHDEPRAGLIILVSAIATWTAHAFSSVIGQRMTYGRRLAAADVVHALRHAWPIVVAALPATAAAWGATVGLWSLDTALLAANLLAVLTLGAAGWVAARATRETLIVSVAWALGTAAIGAAIVIVEVAIH